MCVESKKKENRPLPQKEELVVFKRTERYSGSLPHFYEPEWFPELDILKQNWKAIRDEILTFEKSNGAIKGLDSNPYVAPQFEGENWSNIFLENFMIRHHKNRKKFPVITSLIDKVPNCSFAVISVLSPHTIIKPHYGDTNGIVRAHLGLIIPNSLPNCGIKVGEEEREWKEGEFTLFTEAYLHSAWNHTNSKRYVLVVDIIPNFMGLEKREVCKRLLGVQSFNYLEKRFPIFSKMPPIFMNHFCELLTLGWQLYLPLQRSVFFL